MNTVSTIKHTAVAATLLVTAILVGPAVAQETPQAEGPATITEKLDGNRATLEKWVEVRRTIATQKRDWKLEREALQSRIELLEQEIADLHDKIGKADQDIEKLDKTQGDLARENDTLKQTTSALEQAIAPLEKRVVALLKRLPEPLVELVARFSQRIPKDPEKAEASLGERFQSVVSILNDIDKFNRTITLTSERQKLGNGTEAEVSTIYVGIGQGYYATANADAAAIGTATADGWTWVPANDAAKDIARAIAIHKNDAGAAFVRLPVRIGGHE